MNKAQLKKLEIQGFRSFGAGTQSFELPATVAVFWGGNSQGKSSLAEAIEFLLTGQIARRELLASTKEEFSDSLKNVHLADNALVTVSAEVICTDGQTRTLKRTLTEDYKRGSQDCASIVEIDGQTCQQYDIAGKLGIKLFQPPLSAPVLAQHTLGYVFSAGPTERATYFRAMLDTQDLEDFRIAVSGIPARITSPASPEIESLQAIEAVPELATNAAKIRKSKTQADLEKHLLATCTALLNSLSIPPKEGIVEQVLQIAEELQNRRAKAFSIELFARGTFSTWSKTTESMDECIQLFLIERGKIDKETRSLIELFNAALSLHDAGEVHESIDCPLCGTTDALTSARIALIRQNVKSAESYQTAEKATAKALQEMEVSLSMLSTSLQSALPKFLKEKSSVRRTKGFTIARIDTLVKNASVLQGWIAKMRTLARAGSRFKKAIASATMEIEAVKEQLDSWTDSDKLKAMLQSVAKTQTAYENASSEYSQSVQQLSVPLKSAVDLSSKTGGWEELTKLSSDPVSLWTGLQQQNLHDQKIKNLDKALKDIDAGNGKVADEKFSDMSGEVKKWWDCLRPDEPTFFDAVQRRSAKARRNVDIKVGLSASDDRSNPKFRDAIAVFSQSQLHCLGLSMFLARASQENIGFIIMDDPVLTSDDDFRPNFASTVIECLLANGMQVIILTQDHSSWKDIGHRWDHRGVTQYQIVRNDPVLGTEIRNQKDALATMIAKAQPFIKSQDAEQRKEGAGRIREAIERFGKELLVRQRNRDGETLASISDYNGKNFGEYSNSVYVLLTKDASHPGKLRSAHSYVTPGTHDDTPPSA